MKEIGFNKTYYNIYLLLYSCVFVLECFLVVYFAYFAIRAIVNIYSIKNVLIMLSGFFMSIMFLLTAKSIFTDITAFLRFYGLKIRMLNNKLILYTDIKKCEIPLSKDVDVIFCMMGWLIIWRSENGHVVILIRKSLLGRYCPELLSYFQSNTNYVSSKEGKKKLLKLLQINTFNPLRYIKWPS